MSAWRINIELLGFERGYRTLFLPHRKGGKMGLLALAVRTSWAVEHSLNGRTEGPLLVGRNGQRMQAQTVRRTVFRLCRRIGVTKRITQHSLRHSFVTMALDAGVPERDIVDSTGHADSPMIRYDDRTVAGSSATQLTPSRVDAEAHPVQGCRAH